MPEWLLIMEYNPFQFSIVRKEYVICAWEVSAYLISNAMGAGGISVHHRSAHQLVLNKHHMCNTCFTCQTNMELSLHTDILAFFKGKSFKQLY